MVELKTPVDLVNMVSENPRESKQTYAARAVKLSMQVNGGRLLDEIMLLITRESDKQPDKDVQNEFTNLAVEVQVLKQKYLSRIDNMI